MTAHVAIDLDAALGDTRPLWDAFLADTARRFGAIAELDVRGLPEDRVEAVKHLDGWAAGGVGNWRGQLERFAGDHAPVHLRPDARASAAVRAIARSGARVGVFTDAPAELARVAVAHLGLTRRIELLESGAGSRERVVAALGDPVVVESPAELERLAQALYADR
jgi:phosphoglycolate phosphatase-like HAD superfamily hydrolase